MTFEMNATFDALLAQPSVQNFGWALVHSLWQGAAVALLLRAALALLDESRAGARYAACVAALLLMLVAPAATFAYLDAGHARVERAAAVSGFDFDDDATDARALTAAAQERAESSGAASGEGTPRAAHVAAPLQRWAEDRVTPLLRWLVLTWMAGALLHSLKIFGGWRAAERLRREGIRPVELALEDMLKRLRRRMNVRAAVSMCESVRVEVPTVVGWLKPLILMPAGALAGMSACQLEALLAHELAHVRRHDYLVNLLQAFAEALLFYHPAARWVARQVRAEREHACDDAAVAATKGGALAYARALAELEELRLRGGATRPLALAADGGSLIKRVRRLARPQHARPARSNVAPWLAAAPLAFAFAFAALAGAQAFDRHADEARPVERTAGSVKNGPEGARRAVAVTFVSLPTHRSSRDSVETLMVTTRTILAGLAAYDARAVGFVGEANIGYLDNRVREARVRALRMWVEAGHELGNQTHSHTDLYSTPLEEMRRDVLRGEETAGRLMAERGRRLRFFSYPYLNTGPDAETKKAFEAFLKERGYAIHPVTIDSSDWLFARVHQEALRRGDRETAARVAAEYVPYMERMMEFYEGLSRDTLGREVPQVLMLTTSPVVADQLDELLAMLRARGYRFVTLEEALRDEAYAQPDTYTGEWGISWLQRWAITRGGEFRREPYLPPYMRQFDQRKVFPASPSNQTED